MPNWSVNNVTVTGKPEMIDKIEEIKFDFYRIIPPPQALVDDCEEYCTVCKSREFVDKDEHSRRCTKCNVGSNIGGRVSGYESDKDRYKQLNKTETKLAKSWRKKYGTDSWYEWNIANWGTKWNSGELEMTREDKNTLTARFDTAWSPPRPIFARLSEDYNVRVEVDCEIEGEEDSWRESYGEEV